MSTYYVKFPKMQKSDLWAIKKKSQMRYSENTMERKIIGCLLFKGIPRGFFSRDLILSVYQLPHPVDC